MDIEDWLGKDNTLGIDIWNKKYRYNNESFESWVRRVCGRGASAQEMYNLIIDKKFLFGGRILSSRGRQEDGHKVTYSNCYVLTPPEDSIESIFDTAGKLARTFSYGGGAGIDISKLAPRGAILNNTANKTTGSASFTDLYSMVTGLIGQKGRRGALMISISCEHPDLEEFIELKTDLERNTQANLSVRMTDKFMNHVLDGTRTTLTFNRPETNYTSEKDISPSDVFDKLCEANWDYGEPGCLFWDRVSNWNLLSEFPDFEYAGTNPCGEEPLPAGGSCLLGSLNLSEFVNKDGGFNFESFCDAVRISVIALNEVLDEGMELHPLQEQRDMVRDWRQIGLGIMGLADMFIKMKVTYGSQKSLDIICDIASSMMYTALDTSCELAKDKGCFIECNPEYIVESEFFKHMLEAESQNELRHKIVNFGLRNSQLLTIAPTGSISTMLGISGGMEPIFAKSYNRLTKSMHDGDKEYKVYTPIVKEYMESHNIINEEDLPDYFVTSHDIDWSRRIAVQSAWQAHIDASISSTINIPEDFPKDKVRDIYIKAWRSGCKGITVFRDGCKRDSILSKSTSAIVNTDKMSLIGKKRKLMTGCGSLHCTAFFNGDTGRLMETYLSKGSTGGCANFMTGLSRMISLSARNGCDLESIVDQLRSCGVCPSYAVRKATKGDTSKGACCPMAVGNALVEMQKEIVSELNGRRVEGGIIEVLNPCPQCGAELEFSGGCSQCNSCGWTRCT